MQRLIVLLLFLFSLGCGSKSSENAGADNILEKLTYSVDTVVIDPGDHLINLQFALLKSDISEDKKYLFHLHPSNQVLSVVDLNALKIEKQVQFEKEGPNAMPEFAISIQHLASDNFLFLGMQNSGVFDLSTKKVKEIHRDSIRLEGVSTEKTYSYFYQLKAKTKENLLFSIPYDVESSRYSLAIFDMDSLKGKVIGLPEYGFLSQFELILREGRSYSAANTASVMLSTFPEEVIIHSQGTSSIYRYDVERDSLEFKAYNHTLVPNQKTVPVSRELKSKKEFDEVVNSTSGQISFGDILWDEARGFFFRFASIRKPLSTPESPVRNDVFLFAYDKEFNLVGELEMKELDFQPSWPFFKDGKLWSYVNVDDELGFAVMDFKF
ncbi:DUF4221 family protein [Algoriphagus sp. NF]|uniref:DUF4221 family protein n=1 Tax=Algoriphagus sp. NF TaxID=2992756 RepID=UPI00237A0A29|nr:DUF4221 family protein [Algoriphagus sp. NF]MDE0561126.1 DUF4221 family protein [Algoriphagus sp. NF]